MKTAAIATAKNQLSALIDLVRKGETVIITDRGRPAHVLLSIEQYEALAGTSSNIVDLLALPGAETIRFNPPRLRKLTRAADLA